LSPILQAQARLGGFTKVRTEWTVYVGNAIISQLLKRRISGSMSSFFPQRADNPGIQEEEENM
jgi:hypothetical protein